MRSGDSGQARTAGHSGRSARPARWAGRDLSMGTGPLWRQAIARGAFDKGALAGRGIQALSSAAGARARWHRERPAVPGRAQETG
jgi:hypothetical protein